MKKIIALLLVLICMLSLIACGSDSSEDSQEAKNEKFDIECLDASETLSMALWLKEKNSKPELSAQLAGDGVFYDPETDSLVAEKPSAGYGKGTSEDGGESWGYYSGVENGKGVVTQYDNSYDYTNSYIRVQYDQEANIYYMNWESIE